MFVTFGGWWAWDMGGANHSEKEEVERKEKSSLGSHFTKVLKVSNFLNTSVTLVWCVSDGSERNVRGVL